MVLVLQLNDHYVCWFIIKEVLDLPIKNHLCFYGVKETAAMTYLIFWPGEFDNEFLMPDLNRQENQHQGNNTGAPRPQRIFHHSFLC